MNYEEWYNNYYRRWLQDCQRELEEKVERGLWPWVKEDIAKCDIWEDGSVYMRGTLIVAANWVTSWDNSPHYYPEKGHPDR